MKTHSNPDLLFQALADQQRRRICRYLADRQGDTSSADVVSYLCEKPPAEARSVTPTRRSLEIALRHNHLPLLNDANVIDYDPSDDRIRPGPNLPAAEAALEAVVRPPDGRV